MSAKILPYTETPRGEEAPANQFKDWRLCLQTEHKGRTFSCKVQHDILFYVSPARLTARHFFSTFCLLVKPTTFKIRWPRFTEDRGGIKSDTIFPNRFKKMIRNPTTAAHLGTWIYCSNQPGESSRRGRPTTISHVWIIICGLFHNMGGIGCCLLRNVYVAPQSSAETLIWCETELINWFALVKAAGIIRPKKRP